MNDHINGDAEVKTDFWSGYKGMKVHFPKRPVKNQERNRKERGELKADAPGKHYVQRLAKGYPQFGHESSILYQRVHQPFQLPQNERRNL